MWPYIICFAITLLFAATDEYSTKRIKKYKGFHVFCALMVILLPAILAGCRDYTIGTDVNVYAKPVFDKALNNVSYLSFVHAVDSSYLGSIEPGYLFLAFVISKFTSDAHWFLFAISLFIGFFIYISLYRMKDHCSMFFGQLIYLTMIYNESFNMMRQSMAISIIIFAITFLLDKRWVKYILLMAIAYLFHRSALISLAIPFAFRIVGDQKKTDSRQEIKNKLKWWIRVIGVSTIMAVTVIGFQMIVQFLINLGLISSKYLTYLNFQRLGTFSLKAFICYFLILIVIFGRRNKNWYGYSFLAIEIISLIVYPLQSFMPWLYRIGSYFMYCRIFSASQLHFMPFRILRNKKIRYEDVFAIICIICCIIYWYFFYITWNNHETLPYTSQILEIY